MSIIEIKQSAFGKWLLSQPKKEALMHLWECLSTGPAGNMAWDLWAAVHGEKAVNSDPVRLEDSLVAMLTALEAA